MTVHSSTIFFLHLKFFHFLVGSFMSMCFSLKPITILCFRISATEKKIIKFSIDDCTVRACMMYGCVCVRAYKSECKRDMVRREIKNLSSKGNPVCCRVFAPPVKSKQAKKIKRKINWVACVRFCPSNLYFSSRFLSL